jgi:ribosome-associated translation inhibitor RaiA
MIKVIFKNLDRSELATEAATERMEAVVEKFPDLENNLISITFEMLNSPVHAGPDLFSVKVHVSSGRYRGVRLEKSAPNLYLALAHVIEHMLEVLNRFGDRTRVKERKRARALATPVASVQESVDDFDDFADLDDFAQEDEAVARNL